VVPRLKSELVVRLKFEHATTHMFDSNTTPRLYRWSLSIAWFPYYIHTELSRGPPTSTINNFKTTNISICNQVNKCRWRTDDLLVNPSPRSGALWSVEGLPPFCTMHLNDTVESPWHLITHFSTSIILATIFLSTPPPRSGALWTVESPCRPTDQFSAVEMLTPPPNHIINIPNI
jgi:hypothetical protein